jgi:SNF2 family DNA or RNA helicase
LPDIITVKNNDEYIETSMNLSTPNRIMIDCDIPQFIKLLENHIPSNVMNMINAGNISNAIKTLNCHMDTQDNIFKIISKNYKLSIKNILIDIEAEKKKKYINNKSKIEHKNKIAKMETIKDKIEKKLLSLQKSIYDINDEMCPICMNDFEKPTLVDCCAHKYCFTCLTIILQSSHNKCPICRKIITKNRMHVLDIESDVSNNSDDEIDEKVIKKDKLNELLNIIDNERRFIVFSNFDETFVKMEDEFYKNNIKYGILNKNNSKDMIDRFKNNDINVLLLNTEYFGTGLNLQFATDIILYHRFVPEFEEQIIGRAQRMGRTTKLNVYYLMYENEKVLHRYNENIFF